jgi:hypothetical protein
MKKFFTILAAAMMISTVAMADSTTATDLGTTPFASVAEETPAVVEEATEAPAAEAEVTAAPVAEGTVRIVAFGDESTFTVGDRVGLYAELEGYEGLTVALQWQRWNPNEEVWEDIEGATGYSLWIDTEVGMDGSMWQVVVTVL